MKETCKILKNPFKAGERVTIPAGSVVMSPYPTTSYQQTKRRHTVTVFESHPSFPTVRKVNGGKAEIMIHSPRIRYTGASGQWKEVIITEVVIRENGKAPTYRNMEVELPEQPSEQKQGPETDEDEDDEDSSDNLSPESPPPEEITAQAVSAEAQEAYPEPDDDSADQTEPQEQYEEAEEEPPDSREVRKTARQHLRRLLKRLR